MKRSLVVALLSASLSVCGVAAWAYFHSTGAGTGTAHTTTIQAIAISSSTSTPTTPLLPGQSGDLTLKLDNPNSVAVTIVSVTANGAMTVTGASGCTPSNSGVTFTDQTGLSLSVPASSTAYPIDLAGAVSMSASSNNACQNATFRFPVTVTVHQG